MYSSVHAFSRICMQEKRNKGLRVYHEYDLSGSYLLYKLLDLEKPGELLVLI